MTNHINWPSEAWVQQACLDDDTVEYPSYEEWWDSHSSGVSRLIRKLCIEDYLGYTVSWEEYEEQHGR